MNCNTTATSTPATAATSAEFQLGTLPSHVEFWAWFVPLFVFFYALILTARRQCTRLRQNKEFEAWRARREMAKFHKYKQKQTLETFPRSHAQKQRQYKLRVETRSNNNSVHSGMDYLGPPTPNVLAAACRTPSPKQPTVESSSPSSSSSSGSDTESA
jgi:hypothetical protein